jgi:hypothetical protein
VEYGVGLIDGRGRESAIQWASREALKKPLSAWFMVGQSTSRMMALTEDQRALLARSPGTSRRVLRLSGNDQD